MGNNGFDEERIVETGGGSHPDHVELGALRGDFSPRIGREDMGHSRALAEVFEELPPIVVHAGSLKVIDGMHRVHAARLCGRQQVRVTWFTGSEEDAVIEAIRLNRSHGRPLTLAERREAAQRTLACHPEWSDRRVAEVCGLSPKTVAAVRTATEELPQSPVRVGRDGRRRSAPRLRAGGTDAPEAGEGCEPEVVTDAELSADAAICASPMGAHLAELFSWPAGARGLDAGAVAAAVPLSRVYLLADEARRRSRWWAEVAGALEARAAASRAV